MPQERYERFAKRFLQILRFSVMKTYDKDGNLVSAVPVTYGAQPLPGYDWSEPPRYSSSSNDSSNYNNDFRRKITNKTTQKNQE